MQPGVPHFVYGLEDTIVHGGHFYSSSLMQATLRGMVHTFVLSNFISNTFHYPSRQLLRRIIIFWGLALLENHLTSQGESAAGLHCPCSTQITNIFTCLMFEWSTVFLTWFRVALLLFLVMSLILECILHPIKSRGTRRAKNNNVYGRHSIRTT